MTNETRLKNVRKRTRRKPKSVIVLYEDSGVIYAGDDVNDEVVSQELLDEWKVDENVTLIIISYDPGVLPPCQ